MSKEIESIAAALFDKIRSRFANVTLGNEKAQAEQDPEKARFFNFTYSGADGAEFGNVTISLIDETSVKVYFGKNISGQMDRDHRKEWYEFLRNIRLFAKRNLLSFDTRDINKSNLNISDIKQQAKVDDVATVDDIPVTESKLYGTSRSSYADMDECRLLIKHAGHVSDEIHGDRSRRIEKIFVETARGERFLLGHTNLHGARATARHINEGGEINDDLCEYINNMVREMSAMRHFVRSTKNRQFEDQETANMTRAAVRHYTQLKQTLRHLASKRHYHEFAESFVPESLAEDEVDVDALRERFVKKIYDDRFTEALPIVFRAHCRQQQEAAGQLGTELEEWANTVTEGNWAKPDNTDKVRALQELLKTPFLAGIDGIDATTKLEPLIGDDELFDTIYTYADPTSGQGPDFDCRVLIKQWIDTHMPELADQLTYGQNNASDAQTNFVPQVSPQQDPSPYYGATTMDEPVIESGDSLDFIRRLAGLQK